MDGLLCVNKPMSWTSFDVVNYVKKTLKMKKVGHLGTLDPMATGVLVVTIGNATRLFDAFLNKTKTYVAKFKFGYQTDTLDATGVTTNQTNVIPTLEQIKKILPNFVGEINQLPPQYSAKKVNGQKACDVARNGGSLELKPVKIYIEKLDIIDYRNDELQLKIVCGAGTYIRSLGRDIALLLNSLACMTSLVRTSIQNFKLENAVDIRNKSFDEIANNVMPTDVVFENLPIIDDVEIVNKLLNGQTLNTELKNEDYRLYLNGKFVATAMVLGNKIKMKKYFG